jgi:hypothetical protein
MASPTELTTACAACVKETNCMRDSLLLGLGRLMIPIPRILWQSQVRSNAQKTRARLDDLPDQHTVIQYFCVRELPRVGKPLPPETIAGHLHQPVERIAATLEDLERRMTFLYRSAEGAVAWAYPVTAEETPHHVTFDTGEQIYAA